MSDQRNFQWKWLRIAFLSNLYISNLKAAKTCKYSCLQGRLILFPKCWLQMFKGDQQNCKSSWTKEKIARIAYGLKIGWKILLNSDSHKWTLPIEQSKLVHEPNRQQDLYLLNNYLAWSLKEQTKSRSYIWTNNSTNKNTDLTPLPAGIMD